MNFKSCKEQVEVFFTLEKNRKKLHTKKSIRNMAEVELVKELMGFLLDPKAEVRKLAVDAVAPLTARADCRHILCSETALRGLLRCLTDAGTAQRALEALVNISHEDDAQRAMVTLRAVPTVATQIIDGRDDLSTAAVDLTCKLLSNLTRWPDAAEQLVRTSAADRTLDGVRLLQLAQIYAGKGPAATELDHLASVFCNIAATACGRESLVGGGTRVLAVLVPTVRGGSVTRRRGITGCLRNCAFDETSYTWALCDNAELPSGDVDVTKAKVPVMLHMLPMLIGPEPYKENELAKVPPYIEAANVAGAQREEDDEARAAAVDVLALLCQRRRGREILRDTFLYPVIRELHLWETLRIEDKVDDPDFEPPAIMESMQKVVDAIASDEASYCPVEDGPTEIEANPEDIVD
eukprot:TRINITY_DN1319_c0_g1_i1.p1 TRINITY_DN1319_c0_g1~~TRINITY_DN1319_c0_g1_i1.p1  ORF type:complete len:408 (+),score=194.96 TRINITY_DN1319_c0_g1_i1:55-1278(+)